MKRLLYILAFLPFSLWGQLPNLNWNDCPYNDIAHPQEFITYSGASSGEKIGRMNCNLNHDTIVSIVYEMIEDTSGLLAINSDSVYFESVTGLQKSKLYHFTFSVTDGFMSDTADGYVWVADADSCTEWDDDYSSLAEGHYYYFNRGSTYEIDEPIYIDAEHVRLIAIGNGAYPILECNFSTGSSLPIFREDADYPIIYSLEIHKNGNNYCSRGNRVGSNCDNIKWINNRWIGSAGSNDGWSYIYRHDQDYQVYNHLLLDEYVSGTTGSVGWYFRITGMEIIGCNFRKIDIMDDDQNGDGFIWAFSNYPSYDYINSELDLRYDRIDHSDKKYKHGFCIGGTDKDYTPTYDTVMHCKIIGPGRLNGDKSGNLDSAFTGITLDAASYVYIAYNELDSCEDGLTIEEGDVSNVFWENNIVRGARRYGMLFIYNPSYSKAINNTFTNPGWETSSVEHQAISGGMNSTDTFANNIVHVTYGQRLFGAYDFVRKNNLYTDTTGTKYGGHADPSEICQEDPLFTDEEGYDLTLQIGSPAVNSGKYFSNIVYDFAGNLRDANLDIGAYEYQEETGGETRIATYKGISISNASHRGMPKPKVIKYRGIIYE